MTTSMVRLKTVTFAKVLITQMMVNLRDIAGNADEEGKEEEHNQT